MSSKPASFFYQILAFVVAKYKSLHFGQRLLHETLLKVFLLILPVANEPMFEKGFNVIKANY